MEENNNNTLYKLMILYMLKQVSFPLSGAQMWNFFNEKGYTNYFVFQETVSELANSNLIKQDEVRSMVRLELTKEGKDVLYFFKKDIPPLIIDDMNRFISENKFIIRNETGIKADYYKTENFDFCVNCEVREGNANVFELRITVPTEEQARLFCDNFEDNAQNVYTSVLKLLM